MRVLQLIDSLRPGGAEKMAVNIANGLLPRVEGSYLCCTRQEGLLKVQLKAEVGYVFLNKRSSLDPKAILKLRKYIKENKIDVVHAHSTSYFLAGLLKISGSNFKLIWHDHYGESEFLEKREFKVLKKFSRLFAGIISVNTALKNWTLQNLYCKNVIELKNFIPKYENSRTSTIKLKGTATDFKIICVANLRPQKDHINLLRAFELLDPKMYVSLHLIGEDPQTVYSASVLKEIENSCVNHKIHYYGAQPEIIPLLQQADLGVLSSRSEGLPLALLEYGISGLPVVCTNVGQCAAVINNYGSIVEKENSEMLYGGISAYLNNRLKMKQEAIMFQQEVERNYSEKGILKKYINFIKK
ncbi:glycosyltransferase [Gillisia limnaea]|uniref:Glycosyl transferase group 1 n=1 Tax=Gillisia limnaea (strain DSM 15749 / LMG 21470 / R-8282) TaxID=865937 RepID=H2BUR9_GILLR|nr:glycosyltransferase [Gillisia limnaea]EHQ01724.1 glycosyl transferase group 1 [Gillisia limnaea DSM 15749]